MTTSERCRAKIPASCWKHGSGLGFDANRLIRETLEAPLSPPVGEDGKVDLKRLESEGLAAHIYHFAKMQQGINAERVKKAILLASDLHKTDTRANRGILERTPYIEHPLRNTLRLIRLGCKDEAVLIGSLLHDTVEDHPFEIASKYGKTPTDSEEEARTVSYGYIEKQYGTQVSSMVEGMSNPIIEDRYMPAAQKNIIYRDHVVAAIKNPNVFMGKISDFTDNALSLHHTEATMTSVSLYKKSSKYLLVVDPMLDRLKTGYLNKDLPVPDKSINTMIAQVLRGKQRLLEIQARHKPS